MNATNIIKTEANLNTAALIPVLETCLEQEVQNQIKLEKRSAPLHRAIVLAFEHEGADSASEVATTLFRHAYGMRVMLKDQNAPESVKRLSNAWRRTSNAIGNGLKRSGLVVVWPNIASGLTKSGEDFATILASEDAKDERERTRAAKEASEQKARAVAVAKQAESELSEIQAMTAGELAASLLGTISQWCDADQTRTAEQVLRAMMPAAKTAAKTA